MLRHLSQISNFRVCTVDENEATNSVDSVIAKIQNEFYPLLGQIRRTKRQPKSEDKQEVVTSLDPEDDFISEEEEDIVDMPQSML